MEDERCQRAGQGKEKQAVKCGMRLRKGVCSSAAIRASFLFKMICTVSLAIPASAAQPFIKKQHTRKAELRNADVYACRCRSSSSSNCFSMMRLASSTLRSTSRSISSFLFSNSSSTRLATSSSTLRAFET
ncbi:hypothetical protein EK904_003731 [Melospiza melodia maxima]|nr:hypothetical protein EK904_003731 [Melospiza melodia maxima]